MDHEQLYESFLANECEKLVVCPYCMNASAFGVICCGEDGAEEIYFWNDKPLEGEDDKIRAYLDWINEDPDEDSVGGDR